MPEREIRKRGGAVRWRTVKVDSRNKYGKQEYMRVAVVPKAGSRGGHTVAGPVHRAKGRRGRRRRIRVKR